MPNNQCNLENTQDNHILPLFQPIYLRKNPKSNIIGLYKYSWANMEDWANREESYIGLGKVFKRLGDSLGLS